jgi:hypothetical protein
MLIARCAWAAECLPYEPATVTLEGTMNRRVFPGPPNFESVASGDEKLMYWILRLKSPICVGSTEVTNEVDSFESRVLEVQIAPKDEQFYERNRQAVGKPVKVTGSLFHQHTGWHVTKVVLRATDLSHAQPPAAVGAPQAAPR